MRVRPRCTREAKGERGHLPFWKAHSTSPGRRVDAVAGRRDPALSPRRGRRVLAVIGVVYSSCTPHPGRGRRTLWEPGRGGFGRRDCAPSRELPCVTLWVQLCRHAERMWLLTRTRHDAALGVSRSAPTMNSRLPKWMRVPSRSPWSPRPAISHRVSTEMKTCTAPYLACQLSMSGTQGTFRRLVLITEHVRHGREWFKRYKT